MYYQSFTIFLNPQEILIEWRIYPGTLLLPKTWDEADTDMDGEISSTEAQAWAEGRFDYTQINLNFTHLDWQIESVEFPKTFPEFGIEKQPILLNLRAVWPSDITGVNQVEVFNQYFKDISIHWFTIHGVDGVSFHTPEQDGGLVRFEIIIPEPTKTVETQLIYWDSGTPRDDGNIASLSASGSGATPLSSSSRPSETSSLAEALTEIINLPELSTWNYLLILGTTLLLGGVHALTPGHGKALVAAYLVGSQGTLRHAAILGGIITLTHTGSVLFVGAITLIASQYLLPSILIPGLEALSSIAIIVIGIFMISRGWRGYRSVKRSRCLSLPANEDKPQGQRITIGEEIPVRIYDDVLPSENTSLSWRSLLTLGISGGLVPCPDAIAILFVAAAINRVVLGIVLILAFSMGMAAVLIAIGYTFVSGRGLLEKSQPFRKFSTILPMVSGVIVMGMGVALSFNVVNSNAFKMLPTLIDGSEEAQTDTQAVKPFNINSASILYMGFDEENKIQLFSHQLPDGEKYQLTQDPIGVMEYALSPDGSTIAFFAFSTKGECKLWSINPVSNEQAQLTTYQQSLCNGLTWSPDGERLIFQVLDLSDENASGFTSLWWFDPNTGEKDHIFQDSQFPSFNAGWSPDGTWLTYFSVRVNTTLQIYNLLDGTRIEFPTQSGISPVWSPDGKSLLVIDIQSEGGDMTSHVLRLDILSGEFTNLSQGEGIQDRFVAWSPDGSWIAVVRRIEDDDPQSLGDQLWLILPDSGEAQQLTSGENIIHGIPAWSPDGKYLVFDRVLLDEEMPQQSIWILNVETGELTQITEEGFQPVWLW
jgi:ABC-type nickel/cobalt efflux system permease component RcnA/Tol biopolymer transport system component